MKRFLFLTLMCLSLVGTSQPQFNASTIDIPPDLFSELKNAVVYQKVSQGFKVQPVTKTSIIKGKRTTQKYYVVKPNPVKVEGDTTVNAFGAYMLQMVRNYIHEFGCVPSDSNHFVLHKPRINFVQDGKPMVIPGYTTTIKRVGAEWEMKSVPEVISHTAILQVNGVYQFVEIGVDSLMKMGATYAQLQEWSTWTFKARNRDPNKYLTSMFTYIEQTPARLWNRTFFNGWQWNSGVPTLINSINSTFQPNTYRWKLYNDCVAPANQSTCVFCVGSMGMCAYTQTNKALSAAQGVNLQIGSSPGYDATTNTFTYDPTREWCWMELDLEGNQAQGKNESVQIWINLKTGRISQRMPRASDNY